METPGHHGSGNVSLAMLMLEVKRDAIKIFTPQLKFLSEVPQGTWIQSCFSKASYRATSLSKQKYTPLFIQKTRKYCAEVVVTTSRNKKEELFKDPAAHTRNK